MRKRCNKMKYSLDKYKFYQFKNENGGITVVAASTYAGRTVRGVAKCAPGDTFNADLGENIAAARCNVKVSKRRVRNAERKLKEALRAQYEANARVAKMQSYLADSKEAVALAEAEYDDLIKEA